MSDIRRLRQLAGIEVQRDEPTAGNAPTRETCLRESSDIDEGYRIIPSIDKERYTDLSSEGLEGPFSLDSGKVVYYDPVAGQYYDRDTDMYLDQDEVDLHRKSSLGETAPPGMEDMVKKLKQEYPGEPEKAFATAWSIYNKQHGKNGESDVNEAVRKKSIDPAAISEIASMPHDQAKQKALELLDTSYTEENKKIELRRQIENSRNTIAVAKILYNMLLSGEGLGTIKSRRQMEGYTGDQEVDYEIDRILESASGTFQDMGQALQSVSNFLLESGLTFEQMMSAVESVATQLGAEDTDDESFEMTEEDMNNGYGSECITDPEDYFPSGAEGSVTNRVGPAGTKQGDNPQQKYMATEMARLQDKFKQLLESLSGNDSPRINKIEIIDYQNLPSASDGQFEFDGTVACEAEVVNSQGTIQHLAYDLVMSFSGRYTVYTDDDFSGSTVYSIDDVDMQNFESNFTGSEFYIDNDQYDSIDTWQAQIDPAVLEELTKLTPALDSAIERDLKLGSVIEGAISQEAPTPRAKTRSGFLGR